MLDTRQIHSLSDFVRNSKAHVAQLKATHTPQVLTINGRAELVMLDTETFEYLMERLQSMETIASLRAHMAQARKSAPPREPISEAERELRRRAADELTAETEQLILSARTV